MKVRLEESGCIGCGLCAQICPYVFGLDENGFAKAHARQVPFFAQNLAKKAQYSCPVRVIHLYRYDKGDL